jgi:DNA-binding MarR family transcriptional regulator
MMSLSVPLNIFKLEVSGKKISKTQAIVLSTILTCADYFNPKREVKTRQENGFEYHIFLNQRRIAEALQYSEATIRRTIKILKDSGYIDTHRSIRNTNIFIKYTIDETLPDDNLSNLREPEPETISEPLKKKIRRKNKDMKTKPASLLDVSNSTSEPGEMHPLLDVSNTPEPAPSILTKFENEVIETIPLSDVSNKTSEPGEMHPLSDVSNKPEFISLVPLERELDIQIKRIKNKIKGCIDISYSQESPFAKYEKIINSLDRSKINMREYNRIRNKAKNWRKTERSVDAKRIQRQTSIINEQ